MKKSICITIILFFCLQCTVHSYDVLNEITISGDFLFQEWANTPVTISIDSGTLAGGNGQTIVEQACAEWDSVPNAKKLCGNFIISPTDITIDNLEENILPGVINIVFDETEEILLALGFGPGSVFGFCQNFLDVNTAEITGSLLVLNGTIPSSPNGDLISTTIHEFGHCWGLAHIPIGGINTTNSVSGLDPIEPIKIPTMFPTNIPIDDVFGRTLEDDDKAGISELYPLN